MKSCVGEHGVKTSLQFFREIVRKLNVLCIRDEGILQAILACFSDLRIQGVISALHVNTQTSYTDHTLTVVNADNPPTFSNRLSDLNAQITTAAPKVVNPFSWLGVEQVQDRCGVRLGVDERRLGVVVKGGPLVFLRCLCYRHCAMSENEK